jgi:DeoR/GlpR family transcriptional regulator of sugar metabolism
MLAEARRRLLLDLISRRGFATLDDLVETGGVSESTIRRDLEALDLAGAIRRTHGGAVFVGDLRGMPAFDDRTTSAVAEKRAIGRLAASLVQEGDTVLLDGGTTTLELARCLVGRHVQVVTNSLPIAQLLAPDKDTDLILIGGYVYPRTGVALGPVAIDCMHHIRVHTVFMGAGGIMPDGVYNSNLLLVETERAMMACAQRSILLADRTKFGKQALTRLCPLEDFEALVVDDRIADPDRRRVELAGVTLHLAPTGDPEHAAPADAARTNAP